MPVLTVDVRVNGHHVLVGETALGGLGPAGERCCAFVTRFTEHAFWPEAALELTIYHEKSAGCINAHYWSGPCLSLIA
jgi:hypothetical protein